LSDALTWEIYEKLLSMVGAQQEAETIQREGRGLIPYVFDPFRSSVYAPDDVHL
jgi:hypothetical protein